jgi:Uncharacterized protein conserved in bacteria
MKLLSLIKSDIHKQRRGLIWWMIFVIPLGTAAAMFLDMYLRYKDYLFGVAQKKGITSWQMLLDQNHNVLGWGAFLPLFVAIACAIIYNTEYSGKAMKMVMSFPVSKFSTYASKYVVTLLFSFAMIALNSIGLIVVGKVMGFPEPVDYGMFGRYVLYQYAAVLGSAALHNWLSSRIDNMVYTVLIGIFQMVLSSSLKYNISRFLPYTYPVYSMPLTGYFNVDCINFGIISGILLLILGFIEFRRRDII